MSQDQHGEPQRHRRATTGSGGLWPLFITNPAGTFCIAGVAKESMRQPAECENGGCRPPLPVAARHSGTAAPLKSSSAFIEHSPGLAAVIRCVQPFDHGQGDSTAERQQWAGSVSLEDIEKGVGALTVKSRPLRSSDHEPSAVVKSLHDSSLQLCSLLSGECLLTGIHIAALARYCDGDFPPAESY